MQRRVILAPLAGLLVALTTAAVAFAHGERSQEAFLREDTVAFTDVTFSTDTVKQGESLTISGTARILDTWPKTLAEPTTSFVGVTAPGPVMLRATASGATYDPATKALLMDVQVTNEGDKPMSLSRFIIGNLAFDNQTAATAGADHVMTVDSTQPIQPGETRLLKVTMRDQALEDERLIPLDQPMLAIGGLLTFEDAGGVRNLVTVQSDLVPEFTY